MPLGHQSLTSLVFIPPILLGASVANLVVAGVTESLRSGGRQEALLVVSRVTHAFAEVLDGAG